MGLERERERKREVRVWELNMAWLYDCMTSIHWALLSLQSLVSCLVPQGCVFFSEDIDTVHFTESAEKRNIRLLKYIHIQYPVSAFFFIKHFLHKMKKSLKI